MNSDYKLRLLLLVYFVYFSFVQNSNDEFAWGNVTLMESNPTGHLQENAAIFSWYRSPDRLIASHGNRLQIHYSKYS
jgi:hypothetical protein